MEPMKTFVVVALFAACGGSSGTGGADAPSNVPAMITLSGTASEQTTSGGGPGSGAAITVYRSSDPTTAVGSATADGSGNFSITVTTNGQPVDGFLMATRTGDTDSYLYPSAPLVADFTMASVNLVTTSTFSFFSAFGQNPGMGIIVLEVQDATGMTVAGASVTSTPAATKTGYTGTGGLPDTTATVTATDGRAYLFNLPAGQVTLNATLTGATFKSHAVDARADVFTTTVVTE